MTEGQFVGPQCCGRGGRRLPPRQAAGLFDHVTPDHLPHIPHVIEGARAYARTNGMPDPHAVDYRQVRSSPQLLQDVGNEYEKLPTHDPAALPHFHAFRDEILRQHHFLTNVMGIHHEVTPDDPYLSAQDMHHDLVHNNRIKVLADRATGGHPFLAPDENEKFRAVHDVFGHLGSGGGFDRHSEEAAYLAHARMFSDKARPALATETRGQFAFNVAKGHFGEQKIAVLPRRLWTPGLHVEAKLPKTQKCDYCSKQATKRLLWAEGIAYIPVCDEHEDRGRHRIEVTNHDEVVGVRPVEKTAAFTQHVREHGFTHVDHAAADWPDWTDDVEVDDFPKVKVPLHEITVAAQDHVDPEKVERYKKRLPEGKRVLLRPYGDQVAVMDGHHEIAARRARGEHEVEAHWVDDDPTEWHGQRLGALDLEEYRLADDAQRRRYETAGNAGSQGDYDAYYGQGEQGGRGKERRVTLKDFMQHSRTPGLEDMPAEFQENWRGHEMGYRHARSGRIDHEELSAILEGSPHPDHFMGGYEDGLAAGFGEPVDHKIAVMLDPEHPGQPKMERGAVVSAPWQPLRRTAHVSDNQVDVFHCPFCGSGGIVARADGSIECTFCNSAFTVTVSPVYPSFPQSVNGQPYPWPGRPDGGVDPSMMGDPNADPNASPDGSGFGGKLVPGNGGAEDVGDGDDDSDGDSDDAPPWAKDDDDSDDDDSEAEVGGKKQPPFGKKKSYRTATGAVLPAEEFMRHLAIATAKDPNTMAAQVRAERRG